MDVFLGLLVFASFLAFGVFAIMAIIRAIFKKGMPVKRSAICMGLSFIVLIASFIGFGAVADPVETASNQKPTVKSESVVGKESSESKLESKEKEEKKQVEAEKEEQEEQGKATADQQEKEEPKTETVATPPSKTNTSTGSSSGETTTSDKSKPTQTSGTTEQIPVELVKTIDGDTIKIIYDGKEINVRYLLIDTPETSHPQLGKQPFGEEAKERNKQLVNSGKLTIEFDIGERLDKYDRLLAYVYVDGKSVQQTLVEEGLARVAYVYPPNTRHLTPYEESQQRAKAKKIGIWSIENYTTESRFDGSVKSSDSTSSSGSTGSSSSKTTTSTPTQKAPEQKATPPSEAAPTTENFKNCTELRKVYPNGVPKGHSAYQSKMDRDKDNFACEK